MFASSSGDNKVNVWDCSRIGAEQSEEDAADGPPELLFVHGGHSSKVSDITWCESADWTLASTEENNLLQIWSPSSNIVEGGDEGSDAEQIELE